MLEQKLRDYLDKTKTVSFSNDAAKTRFINKVVELTSQGDINVRKVNVRDCVHQIVKDPDKNKGFTIMTQAESSKGDDFRKENKSKKKGK